MQVSLNWLSTHLDLSSFSTPQLSDLLTFAGIEVEGIEEKGVSSDKVIVAQIQSFEPLPNSDKLSICQVDDGSGSLRQIVCGAKNFKAGDKVPLALPGAVLPGGFQISEGKLRGVVSNGMMCSAKELGIGEDTGGLWILDGGLPVGKPLNQIVESDTLFDLEITPNRSDLLSHLGLARELAALTGLSLKSERDHRKTTSTARAAKADEVALEDTEGCPYYTARVIKGVKVGPSPEWLKTRLESIGLRPINNIVDITNYVMMEMGQSLHCFDLDKLQGGIAVRRAKEGEKILALDGQEYSLLVEDLVITDGQRPVAIAGVMGGEETGVVEGSTNILLEAAYFAPSTVRRTARRLNLHSDSSYRFERGIDPQQVHGGSDLATKLILEIAGGTAEAEIRVAGEAPTLVNDVVLDEVRAHKLLGISELKTEEAHDILSKLGLIKKSGDAAASTWSIPSYRLDLLRSVDLVEEIARVIGLDRVPAKFTAAFAQGDGTDKIYDHAMQLRQALANRGFNEAQTLRLIATGQTNDALGNPTGGLAALKNPLSEDHTTLRPSIVPGLLASAALNVRQGADRLRLFEIGRVFLKMPNGMVREEERLAILLSGPVAPSTWHAREPKAADIFDLRGLVESLPGVSSVEIKPLKDNGTFLLHSELKAGNRVLGWIAQVHPARARALDARTPVYVVELLLSALRQGSAGPAKFTDLPRFPSITRDVAFELSTDVSNAKVTAFFGSVKEPLLISTALFDVFADPSGTKLPKDRKSLAWTLTYRASDKTLETAEVDAAHSRIVAALEKALPVVVRR
ncbi:phenylalanine--tRNA ligase subunit beta [Brevifollis gellanilyticus]|uniref:Phenylalanine--tRNA ligase beta subunit n=1 Tax=Brevifollis gellanilyticus TaxID=748831 RepID=A0A512M3K6_9BACT|nr:phenylalanine--tRNA ligase subunit beta [Brevifollis gellanilyticus]GEP41320.1 phenylalanine--tRNA ligase beta subunit [Brevifollis gellanilyticus]